MGAETVAIQQAIVINALKANGAIIHLEPEQFEKLASTIDAPLVVAAEGGVFSTHYKYVMHYKGLTMYCKSKEALNFPANTEWVVAKTIVVPDL